MEISQITTFKNEHYELLSIADPNRKLVAHYLEHSVGFQMIEEGKLVGVLVLTPINQTQIELKNISIATKLQHQGKAQFFIQFALKYAKQKNYQEMLVGTGSTSFVQLYLYQKMGFRCFDVKTNFFTDNYADPIFENGLQLHDMLMLRQKL